MATLRDGRPGDPRQSPAPDDLAISESVHLDSLDFDNTLHRPERSLAGGEIEEATFRASVAAAGSMRSRGRRPRAG
jgi:hypothetical protein